MNWPQGLYCDIRTQQQQETACAIENGSLRQNRIRDVQGALIRVYDGQRWYMQATSSLDGLQAQLDQLAQLARPADLSADPVVNLFEGNLERLIRYKDQSVSVSSRQDKLGLLQATSRLFDGREGISQYRCIYQDAYSVKRFISSKGADVAFDNQFASLSARYQLLVDDKPGRGSKDLVKTCFSALNGHEPVFLDELEKDLAFVQAAVPVEAGSYTCVLAPLVTGVFAHESFGHKSEADFMIGDDTMQQTWALGKTVGIEQLNILDRGDLEGNGYVPFDDEGTRARVSHLIRHGKLAGRLHSITTAALLGEAPTGNARAVNVEFEPIVRMTNTYIDAGDLSFDDLIKPIRKGLYIETLNHGSGMTTFTIAPQRAYWIEDGRIGRPVLISVLTGNVMQTLHRITGLSDQVEWFSFALGGCGKMEQYPLRVSFGGPAIRVDGIHAR